MIACIIRVVICDKYRICQWSHTRFCLFCTMQWVNSSVSVLLLLMAICISNTELSPVLVQCSNATLSNSDDTGLSFCWKEGALIVCNSLELGLREAERLGTSMLVENTSQCNEKCRLESDKDRISHSVALTADVSPLINTRDSTPSYMEVTQRQYSHHAMNGAGLANVTLSRSRCSPGFIPKKNGSSHVNQNACICLEGVEGIVRCAKTADSESAYIMDGYCMTYDNISGDIAIGYCMLACQVNGSLLDGHTGYYSLPENSSYLDKSMCSKVNRRGFLCSECSSEYKPLAYSYRHKCIPCNLSRKQLALNWMGYLALAVLPQSILFLLMAIFRVGVTAPPFSSMVQVFQAITTPQYVKIMIKFLSCWEVQFGQFKHATVLVMLAGILYGFFNLDFLRYLDPPLCLDLDFIQLKMLDYASAIWPLLLIILSYILVELHSRGFKPIILIWKPVHHCLKRCQYKWHIKSSLVETFASFLLLSWIKLLSISCELLITTCVLTVNSKGNISQDCTHLYNSPSIRLFEKRHFLPGMVAVLVLIIFIIFPLFLLLVYPFKVFHKLLNKCGLHFRALHVFMDSFQGSFKNGTDGTTDYRWFSSSYLIVRIFFVVLGPVLKNRFFFSIASLVLIVFAAAIYIIQPYKKPYHNIFDATLILTLAAIFSSHSTVAIAQLFSVDKNLLPSLILAFILSLLPIVIGIGYTIWWLITMKLRLCSHICQYWQLRRAAIDDSLADRVNHPQDYDGMDLALF